MTGIDAIIDGVIQREGLYSDRAADNGGPTMYGITAIVARANGYTGPMQDLPLSLARTIYRRRYIGDPGFDKLAIVDEAVAEKLIDVGVNMGPTTASTFFQRWLNAFNSDGSHYADIFVDGHLGDVTIASYRAFLKWRGPQGSAVLLEGIRDLQGSKYLALAEADKKQRENIWGWMLQRVLTKGTTP